jgi:hypothetical protein
MARAYKILGQSSPSANVLTTLYTVPAGNSAIISTITIANLDEGSANGGAFRIAANTSGSATANANYLAYGVNVPGRDTVTLTLGITLAAGSQISVNANSALLAFSAFGTEIY